MKKNSNIGNFIKKCLLIIICISCLCFIDNTKIKADLTIWDGESSVEFETGDGSSLNPYLINNARDFAYFRDTVNSGINYLNKYIKLNCDLDLNNLSWSPIGISKDFGFKGNFDGNNHTISNVKIDKNQVIDINEDYFGLFGYIDSATISNLDVFVDIDGVSADIIYSGAIAGYNKNSEINNCHAFGSIDSTVSYQDAYTGGIVGYNEGKIINSSSECQISTNSLNQYNYFLGDENVDYTKLSFTTNSNIPETINGDSYKNNKVVLDFTNLEKGTFGYSTIKTIKVKNVDAIKIKGDISKKYESFSLDLSECSNDIAIEFEDFITSNLTTAAITTGDTNSIDVLVISNGSHNSFETSINHSIYAPKSNVMIVGDASIELKGFVSAIEANNLILSLQNGFTASNHFRSQGAIVAKNMYILNSKGEFNITGAKGGDGTDGTKGSNAQKSGTGPCDPGTDATAGTAGGIAITVETLIVDNYKNDDITINITGGAGGAGGTGGAGGSSTTSTFETPDNGGKGGKGGDGGTGASGLVCDTLLVNITTNSIFNIKSGAGGAGGTGGAGGKGGDALWPSNNGGTGGTGGKGGAGGSCNAPLICDTILLQSGTVNVIDNTVGERGTGGGAGGAGARGGSSGNPGGLGDPGTNYKHTVTTVNEEIEYTLDYNLYAGGLVGFNSLNGNIIESYNNSDNIILTDSSSINYNTYGGSLLGYNLTDISNFKNDDDLLTNYVNIHTVVTCENITENTNYAVVLDNLTNENDEYISEEIKSGVVTYRLKYKLLNNHKALISGIITTDNSNFDVILQRYILINNEFYEVIKIGENAFNGKNISKVIMHDYIDEVMNSAFANCSYLTDVKMSRNLITIKEEAFSKCVNLTNITWNNKLKTISEKAFFASGLKELTLPNTVETIAASAFENCYALSNIVLSKSLISIGENAFKETTVSSIVIPDNVVSIDKNAFSGTRLQVVVVGESVNQIDESAFATLNDELKYVYFTGNCPLVNGDIFGNNTNTIIYIEKATKGWNIDCVGLTKEGTWTTNTNLATWPVIYSSNNFLIFNVITEEEVFNGKSYIVSYDKNGIKYFVDKETGIAKVAGYNKEFSETNITIPTSVIYDGNVYEVDEIIDSAFKDAVTLVSVRTGEYLNNIGDNAFAGCTNLEQVYVGAVSNLNIGNNAFANTKDSLQIVLNYEVSIYEGNNYYVNYILQDGYDEQGIYYTFKDGVAYVGSYNSLETDDSANTSKYNGDGYYSGKKGYVILPDYVMSDGVYYKVVSIGRYAFYNCEFLEKISMGAFIGENVNNEDSAFFAGVWDCSFRNARNLTEFEVDDRNELYAEEKGSNSGSNGEVLYELGKHPVTQSKVALKIVKAGKDILNYSTTSFNTNVNTVEAYAFANSSKLSGFTWDKITKIGTHAFENTLIEEANLYNVDSVGDMAFTNCVKLENVYIGVPTSLGKYVFKNCQGLMKFESTSTKYIVDDNGTLYEDFGEYVVLLQHPARSDYDTDGQYIINEYVNTEKGLNKVIKYIEAYAFAYSYVQEVTIGENVLSIGKACFENCVRLREINIGKNVVYIGVEITTDVEGTLSFLEVVTKEANETLERYYGVYEQEVFNNCYVLSNIVVDEENRYYYSDNNGILYDKHQTKLLLYAQGISRITFTIPQSVEYIALEAFQNNMHLQRLIVPSGVKEIGAKAFNGCVYLKYIYFRTLEAPIIHEQVFNSTGGAIAGGVTIGCIPEVMAWLGDNYSFWSSYLDRVEKYNVIQEIGNQTEESADLYVIVVVDGDGNPIEGINMLLTTNGRERKAVSDEFGYLQFALPDSDSFLDENKVNIHLTDPSGIYYDYKVECSVDADGNYVSGGYPLDLYTKYSYAMMFSKGTVIGLYCEDDLIDVDTKIVNLAEYIKTEIKAGSIFGGSTGLREYVTKDGKYVYNQEQLYITAKAMWDKTKGAQTDILSLEIIENDRIISEFTKNELFEEGVTERFNKSNSLSSYDFENGLFKFAVDIDDLTKNAQNEYYVRMVFTYEGKRYETKTLLNLTIYEKIIDTSTLMDEAGSIDLNFAKDIPYLGSLDLSIEITKLFGLEFEYEEDKFTIAMNFSADVYDEHNKHDYKDGIDVKDPKTGETVNWPYKDDKAKDYFNRLHDTLKNNKFFKDAEDIKSKKVTLEWGGAVQFAYDALENQIYVNQGYIYGQLSFKYEVGTTCVFFHIPIRLDLELSVSGKLQLSVYNAEFDENLSWWQNNPLSFEFDFEVTAGAGVGCSLASIQIYGSVGIEALVKIGGPASGQVGINILLEELKLTFDLGLRLKVDIGIFDLTYKISLNKILKWPTEYIIYGKDPITGEYKWMPTQKEIKSINAETVGQESYENLEGHTNIRSAINFALRSVLDEDFKQSGTVYENYGGLEPVIVEHNDSKYMFYIDNVYLNPVYETEGYDEYNYLKLVYQKLVDGVWSTPVIVNDNKLNDTEFDVVSENGVMYVVYKHLEKTISSTTKEQYESLLQVGVSKFNNESQSFEFEKVLDNGGSYINNLHIEMINGSPVIIWMENSDNNMLGLSNYYQYVKYDELGNVVPGTESDFDDIIYDATTANSIWYSYLEGNTWNTISKDGYGLLLDLQVVQIENETYIAYILDKDSNIPTSTDHEIYLLHINDNQFGNSTLEFAEDAYEDLSIVMDKMSYYLDENIYIVDYVDGDLLSVGLFIDTKVDFDVDYQILYDELGNVVALFYVKDESMIVSELGEVSGEMIDVEYDLSNLYVRYYDNVLADFGYPVQVTNMNAREFIYTYDVYLDNNQINMEYVKAYDTLTVNEEENPIYIFSFNNQVIEDEKDVILQDVSTSANVVLNEEFTLTTVVVNNSFQSINQITIEIYDENGNIIEIENNTVEINILSGYSQEVEFTLTLNNISALYNVKIYTNIEEENYSNNEIAICLSYSDLMLNTKAISLANINYIVVQIMNIGSITAESGTIYIDKGAHNMLEESNYNTEDALYELAFGAIKSGESKYYTIELNSYYFTEGLATVYVVNDSADADITNNYKCLTVLEEQIENNGDKKPLNYYIDGQLVKTVYYEPGQLIEPFKPEEKIGYTFSGWSGIMDYMPSYDVNCYGSYIINRYKIEYYVDDVLTFVDSFEYDENVIRRSDIVKSGYTFSGWVNLPTTMPAEDVRVDGTFTINSYNINYYVDSKLVKTESVEYNSTITPYSHIAKTGYTFSGWQNLPTTMPHYDIDVVGYESINYYDVLYYVDGELKYTESTPYNKELTVREPETKVGYTFSGWSQLPTTMPANDVRVDGTFTINKYTITFDTTGGTTIDSITQDYNTEITLAQSPTKVGYTFAGWDQEIPQAMPAANITLTAKWEINSYKVLYYVDGELKYTENTPYNKELVVREAETKVGYTFSGWSQLPTTMPANDVRVDGTFTINSYNINYYVDNELKYTDTYQYLADVTMRSDESKDGYTFSGWNLTITNMKAENIDVYGNFTINKYIVNYYVDNKVVSTKVYNYGESVDLTPFEKEKYEFNYWTLNEEEVKSLSMPNSNLDLHANMTEIEKTFGEKIESISVFVVGGVTLVACSAISVGLFFLFKKKRVL